MASARVLVAFWPRPGVLLPAPPSFRLNSSQYPHSSSPGRWNPCDPRVYGFAFKQLSGLVLLRLGPVVSVLLDGGPPSIKIKWRIKSVAIRDLLDPS